MQSFSLETNTLEYTTYSKQVRPQLKPDTFEWLKGCRLYKRSVIEMASYFPDRSLHAH